ncbi:GNAT family N-acetyltransferase, partial [Nostoc sp. NIES-2111]
LMYAVSGRSLVALGHPVGDPQRGTELAWAFRELADRLDARPVFYQVGVETLPTYLDMRLSVLKIAEVARLDLAKFTMAGTARQNLRNARRRLEKEGLVFSLVPAADVPAMLDEMQEVSDAWFAGKSGGEKGFSIGRFDRDYLSRFDVGVLRRDGELVAFANIWRGADKAEMTVDLMRYRPGVSRIVMDGLFVELILMAQAEGYRWFELGPAPLSGLVDHRLASWWNRIGSFIYRRGEEYYNFEGLRTFKQKFGPEWTPLYVACPGLLDTPKALMDLTALIAGGSPLRIFRNATSG